MGKKGRWFSAIKRVFIPTSKEKLIDGPEKKSSKEKKRRGLGKRESFIPRFREPSSIEKILGEAEKEHNLINFRPVTPLEQPKTPPYVAPTPPRAVASPKASADPRATAASPRAPMPPRAESPPWAPAPPKLSSPPRASTIQQTSSTPLQIAPPPPAVTPPRAPSRKYFPRQRPEPTLRYQHACATKIQTGYRGYMARRNYRALKGLVRLQSVVKGQNVKRQTMNAMKCMQLLVRVQTQIQSRRIQMLENQALQRQAKEIESSIGKWSQGDKWDDSMLPKDEADARTQRKVEAVMKRERATAYAYSRQSWKSSQRIGQAGILGSGGFPWRWNWLERQMSETFSTAAKPSDTQTLKNFFQTPPRSAYNLNTPSPLPQSGNFRNQNLSFDNLDTPTPRSTRSAVPLSFSRGAKTPPALSFSRGAKTPPGKFFKYIRTSRGNNSPFNGSFKDDDSLTCPPFSVPRYMESTASAKAKVRGGSISTPRERLSSRATTPTSTAGDESNRRLSLPLSQGIGSFKWSKRSPMFSSASKETNSQRGFKNDLSAQSVGNMSVDSTGSTPATVGKKPFNRFV